MSTLFDSVTGVDFKKGDLVWVNWEETISGVVEGVLLSHRSGRVMYKVSVPDGNSRVIPASFVSKRYEHEHVPPLSCLALLHAISIGNLDTEYKHINIGQIDMLELMARIEALEAQVLELRYAPGMPGAIEARASFDQTLKDELHPQL